MRDQECELLLQLLRRHEYIFALCLHFLLLSCLQLGIGQLSVEEVKLLIELTLLVLNAALLAGVASCCSLTCTLQQGQEASQQLTTADGSHVRHTLTHANSQRAFK